MVMTVGMDSDGDGGSNGDVNGCYGGNTMVMVVAGTTQLVTSLCGG
jgi:hypothetical protein